MVDLPLPWPPSRHLGRADVSGTWSWSGEKQRLHGEMTWGPQAEGLPLHVHGGLVAALCDEAMGWTCWMAGWVAAGARVSTDFRVAQHVGDTVTIEAWVEAVAGRKLSLRAEVTKAGRVCASAEGLFVAIAPPDWSVFAGWPALDRFDSVRGPA